MRKKINKVRYSYVRKKAAEFIVEMSIKQFPVEPLKIISLKGWSCRTFKFYAQKHRVSIKSIIEAYETEDGFTTYNNGLYSIAFNDLIRSPGRIRFTLMHEIGHIYLKHLEEYEQTILSRGGLSDEEYETLETEAHIFASEVLSPQLVLLALGWNNYSAIKKYCGLSLEASKTRASQISYLLKSGHINYKSPIIASFYDFIYKKRCPRCKHGFVSENAIYCPICRRKVIWGEGEMKYDGVELDEKYKALICPRCENEELSPEGEYCAICGAYLINKCADIMDSDSYRSWVEKEGCGSSAAGYARYCVYCGNPTTFFQNGLLKKWEEAKALLLGIKLEAASTRDDDIPF